MKSKFYRCGWCGYPTDKNGKVLKYGSISFEKANRILMIYDPVLLHSHTVQVNGECCPGGDVFNQLEP